MSVYMVVLQKPSEEVWATIRKKWPDRQHYILDERVAFIAPSDKREQIILIEDLANMLGMDDEKQVTGFVSEVTTINGWHDEVLWEWLDKVFP